MKISAVCDDIGEVDRVTFKLNELNEKSVFQSANGGMVRFTKCDFVVMPTFLDYLRSGLKISLGVAVDYTGSNGEYHLPSSLHYMGPGN